MSGSPADLDGAIARLNKAMGALEARVQDLKANADSPRASGGDDDLFAERRQESVQEAERRQALEEAAREASRALDQAASEIRAVLQEA